MRGPDFPRRGGVLAVLCGALWLGAPAGAIDVTPSTDAMAMAQSIAGPGVEIVSASYTGAAQASGFFTGGLADLGFAQGVLLTTGLAADANGPNDLQFFGMDNGAPGDPGLAALLAPLLPPGDRPDTFNASVLEFTFVPDRDEVELVYVFASEEYLDFVEDLFNDVVSIELNGQNVAVVPGSNDLVTINSVHCGIVDTPTGPVCARPGDTDIDPPAQIGAFFADNGCSSGNCGTGPQDAPLFLQYNGLVGATSIPGTVRLTAGGPVVPDEENTLRIAIGDLNDPNLDSAVFLEGFDTVDVVPVLPPFGGAVFAALLLGGVAALGALRRPAPRQR